MAGISRPSSPLPFERQTVPAAPVASGSYAAGGARGHAVAKASSAPALDSASKDPAYYSLYLRDVHVVLTQTFERGAAKAGHAKSEWIYKPIPAVIFDKSLFERVEAVRMRSIAEGGFGRDEASAAQKSFNRLTFDVIRGIIEDVNNNTSIEYTPGIGSAGLALGLRGERLAISSANFMSKIEKKMLETLFSKRSASCDDESEEEYVDNLAREAAGKEAELFELEVRVLCRDPVYAAAMLPYASAYEKALPTSATVEETAEAASERITAQRRVADAIALKAFEAADRALMMNSLSSASASTAAPKAPPIVGGSGAFRVPPDTVRKVMQIRDDGVVTSADSDAISSARSTLVGSAATIESGSPASGRLSPALLVGVEAP